MVSSLNSGSSGPGSSHCDRRLDFRRPLVFGLPSPRRTYCDRSHCVVSLGKTLYFPGPLFNQVYKWVPASYAGGSLAMD